MVFFSWNQENLQISNYTIPCDKCSMLRLFSSNNRNKPCNKTFPLSVSGNQRKLCFYFRPVYVLGRFPNLNHDYQNCHDWFHGGEGANIKSTHCDNDVRIVDLCHEPQDPKMPIINANEKTNTCTPSLYANLSLWGIVGVPTEVDALNISTVECPQPQAPSHMRHDAEHMGHGAWDFCVISQVGWRFAGPSAHEILWGKEEANRQQFWSWQLQCVLGQRVVANALSTCIVFNLHQSNVVQVCCWLQHFNSVLRVPFGGHVFIEWRVWGSMFW